MNTSARGILHVKSKMSVKFEIQTCRMTEKYDNSMTMRIIRN